LGILTKMKRYQLNEISLIHPEDNKNINFNLENNSFSTDHNIFENFYNIPNLYIKDDSDLTEIQSNFYNDIKFPNYDDIDDFGSLIDKASKSIFAKKLDDEIPMNSKILEAGCGTGQLSLFLSRFSRKIFSIDLSKESLIEGEKFREKNSIKNVFFFRMNIFKLCFKKNFFDIVISNGVLHHTINPELAFANLVKVLKKDGIIIIGLYHKYGRLVTKIRQKIISLFGDKMKFMDPRFKKNISENKKYAWFLDQYKNPSEKTHTLSEIHKWFEKNNIEFLSSIPFNYTNDAKLFEKKEKQSNLNLFFDEIFQAFSYRQIKEGGFFIIIGKKK